MMKNGLPPELLALMKEDFDAQAARDKKKEERKTQLEQWRKERKAEDRKRRKEHKMNRADRRRLKRQEEEQCKSN